MPAPFRRSCGRAWPRRASARPTVWSWCARRSSSTVGSCRRACTTTRRPGRRRASPRPTDWPSCPPATGRSRRGPSSTSSAGATREGALSPLTPLAGVFVGGLGSRMGGVPKGLLHGPDGATLVERWRALLDALGVEVVLVGSAGLYASTRLPAVADEPAGIGPLGGLVGLLRRAGPRQALALA